jgi:hypothetical protein
MKSRIFVVLVLSGLFLGHSAAQSQSDLDMLEDKLSRHLETKMPGWKHKRGEPIQGSKNVLIEFWAFSNRVVKVSIIPQKSAEEAREKLQSFANNTREAEELRGLGDQAYTWGYAGSNVVFRRGRFAVFVSTYAEVDSDPDARMLSQSERVERERSEMRRLSKEFAKHMAAAIDLP